MLESLINPKRAEKGPWKMFFIGLLYASLSILLVQLFFAKDPVLSKSSGILVVTFSVMFSLPFMYYIIKQEEQEDEEISGLFSVWKTHSDAIFALMWLFLGFIIAFSFWYVILGNSGLFNSQVETYCMINSPGDIQGCIQKYGFSPGVTSQVSAGVVNFLSIIENNTYVLIFTLILSLIFGAGAIFVLSWNASVIAAAIGIFTSYKLVDIPLGIARYMIHGFPEIAAYFIAALAGGMLGAGFIRHGIKDRRFLKVIQNVIILLFIAVGLLVVASLMEVYLTPILFR
ncbi:MAG TPA: stage II sporulation protein M [Patescibacteria group bacterium]|nr:stage II sporulation protein M [Patescibacteria group bacterium]